MRAIHRYLLPYIHLETNTMSDNLQVDNVNTIQLIERIHAGIQTLKADVELLKRKQEKNQKQNKVTSELDGKPDCKCSNCEMLVKKLEDITLKFSDLEAKNRASIDEHKRLNREYETQAFRRECRIDFMLELFPLYLTHRIQIRADIGYLLLPTG